MRHFIVLFLMMSLGLNVHGATLEQAMKVQSLVANHVYGIEGMNGIGLGQCHPRTAAPHYFEKDAVHCVQIMALDFASKARIERLILSGSKINGVFVVIEITGPASAL